MAPTTAGPPPSDSYSGMEHGDSIVDTFEYTISDGTGRTDVATVTIGVHAKVKC